MKIQREIIDKIARDVKELKKGKPNGDIKRLEVKLCEMCDKQDRLYDLIMDPETGLVVSTNKNTEFRTTCAPEREILITKFQGVLRWKRAIEWGLGVLFIAFVGALIKYFAG